jgi:hypothetical protein
MILTNERKSSHRGVEPQEGQPYQLEGRILHTRVKYYSHLHAPHSLMGGIAVWMAE